MIEEEAKTKWCPFVRQSAQAARSNRGDHPNASNVNCIGSACMAWRVTDDECMPVKKYSVTVSFPAGYCGLAGKPE